MSIARLSITTAALVAALAAGGTAWAHAGRGCAGAESGKNAPAAGEHRHGPQAKGEHRGHDVQERHARMSERMARMHGEKAGAACGEGSGKPCDGNHQH